MRTFEGKVVAKEIKVGIVAARFNEFIVSKLVAGARDGLLRHDVKDEDIDLAWVPGAFEIPLIASKMAKSGKYDAVICLGAVIRGATSHYDYVCSEVSKGIASVSLTSDIPVMFGVLTARYQDDGFQLYLWQSVPQVHIKYQKKKAGFRMNLDAERFHLRRRLRRTGSAISG